ncbi:MAG TPA: XdhC /CoxI family-like protein, partial [Alphaproteobacteria bacterium]|nr:XdhC /CoxI family-like protein [Alphaproteobacteria bacterium]
VIDRTQEQLRADAVPHAVATVVRTLSSTAAKPGMKAIVLA